MRLFLRANFLAHGLIFVENISTMRSKKLTFKFEYVWFAKNTSTWMESF